MRRTPWPHAFAISAPFCAKVCLGLMPTATLTGPLGDLTFKKADGTGGGLYLDRGDLAIFARNPARGTGTCLDFSLARLAGGTTLTGGQ